MDANENEIIRKAQDGDIACFESLVEKHKNKVFGTALALSGDIDEAEEVAQRVFIKLWKNIGKFRFKSAFSTWLYRIAHNTFLNYIREKQRYRDKINNLTELPEHKEYTSAGDDTEKNHIKEEIHKALKCIPDEFRMAVIYYDIEGKSYSEISGIIGMPEGTVKSRLFRGRKMLKEKIGNIL